MKTVNTSSLVSNLRLTTPPINLRIPAMSDDTKLPADLLRNLERLTTEPALNLRDVPARPTLMVADAELLEEAAARIRESWRLYRSNQGA